MKVLSSYVIKKNSFSLKVEVFIGTNQFINWRTKEIAILCFENSRRPPRRRIHWQPETKRERLQNSRELFSVLFHSILSSEKLATLLKARRNELCSFQTRARDWLFSLECWFVIGSEQRASDKENLSLLLTEFQTATFLCANISV